MERKRALETLVMLFILEIIGTYNLHPKELLLEKCFKHRLSVLIDEYIFLRQELKDGQKM